MSALFKPPNADDGGDAKPSLSAEQIQAASTYPANGSSARSWQNSQPTLGADAYGAPKKAQPSASKDNEASLDSTNDVTLKNAPEAWTPRREMSGPDAFTAAANRTRHNVQPTGGRRESAATIVPEAITSATVVSMINRAADAAKIGPSLFGDVAEGRLDPDSPEAIRRSFNTALTFAGGGAFGAQRGALGATGGRLPPRPPVNPTAKPAATSPGRSGSRPIEPPKSAEPNLAQAQIESGAIPQSSVPANKTTSAQTQPPTGTLPQNNSTPVGSTSNAATPPPSPPQTLPSTAPAPRPWQQYEAKHGSKQTRVTVEHEGQLKTFRLDFPVGPRGIVDLKEFNWQSPAYQKPFVQKMVVEQYKKQIANYLLLHPNVQYQFSMQPPQWVARAISEAGGSFVVKP